MFYLLAVFHGEPVTAVKPLLPFRKYEFASLRALVGLLLYAEEHEETCPWRFTLKITLWEGWLAGLHRSISPNKTVIFLFHLRRINSIKIECGHWIKRKRMPHCRGMKMLLNKILQTALGCHSQPILFNPQFDLSVFYFFKQHTFAFTLWRKIKCHLAN